MIPAMTLSTVRPSTLDLFGKKFKRNISSIKTLTSLAQISTCDFKTFDFGLIPKAIQTESQLYQKPYVASPNIHHSHLRL